MSGEHLLFNLHLTGVCKLFQNVEVLKKMGKYTGITSECAIPADSASYVPMAKRAPITAQVVIGTPGTIKKWMSLRKLGVSCMKILVFDEADHMLAEVSNIHFTCKIVLYNFVYCSKS